MADAKLVRAARLRRHRRVRRKVSGTADIYAQLIDDGSARTLASASDRELGPTRPKRDAARAVGELIATRAKDAGIQRAVFDRGGRLYHGRVAAVADGARDKGLAI
jgi:large subunit ribosomal protein L18